MGIVIVIFYPLVVVSLSNHSNDFFSSLSGKYVRQQYNGSAHLSTCSLLLPLRKMVIPFTPSR